MVALACASPAWAEAPAAGADTHDLMVRLRDSDGILGGPDAAPTLALDDGKNQESVTLHDDGNPPDGERGDNMYSGESHKLTGQDVTATLHATPTDDVSLGVASLRVRDEGLGPALLVRFRSGRLDSEPALAPLGAPASDIVLEGGSLLVFGLVLGLTAGLAYRRPPPLLRAEPPARPDGPESAAAPGQTCVWRLAPELRDRFLHDLAADLAARGAVLIVAEGPRDGLQERLGNPAIGVWFAGELRPGVGRVRAAVRHLKRAGLHVHVIVEGASAIETEPTGRGGKALLEAHRRLGATLHLVDDGSVVLPGGRLLDVQPDASGWVARPFDTADGTPIRIREARP